MSDSPCAGSPSTWSRLACRSSMTAAMSSSPPIGAFTAPSATWSSPQQLSRLSQEQAEVLAIVISDGMATRRRIEEVRGAATVSIGPEGPVSLPRDSSETLALLLSRGLLCAERDDHATGRPLVYRPTPRLLQLLGAETLEEARQRMGVPADYRRQAELPTPAGPESLGSR